jgi:hypothetical protein
MLTLSEEYLIILYNVYLKQIKTVFFFLQLDMYIDMYIIPVSLIIIKNLPF